jgi:hypothetical protein
MMMIAALAAAARTKILACLARMKSFTGSYGRWLQPVNGAPATREPTGNGSGDDAVALARVNHAG